MSVCLSVCPCALYAFGHPWANHPEIWHDDPKGPGGGQGDIKNCHIHHAYCQNKKNQYLC